MRATHARMIVVATLAPLLLGATCENIDVSEPFETRMEAGESTALIALAQSRLSRLAVDYGVTNIGAAPGEFVVSAQVQTSGSPLDAACDIMARQAARPIIGAGAEIGDRATVDAPVLGTRNVLYAIELADERFTMVEVRTSRDTRLRVTLQQPVRTQLLTQAGTLIPPFDADETGETCALAPASFTYELTRGTYRLSLEPEDEERELGPVPLVAEDACTATRRVPRTCSGQSSEVITPTPHHRLDSGQSTAGRIGMTELGIGDTVLLNVACGPTTPDCQAALEVFVISERIDCRSNAECRGAESCTVDGYCVRRSPPRGCTFTHEVPTTPGWFVAWLVALGLVRRKQGRRAPWGFPVAFAICASVGVFAPSDAVAQDNAQVYFQPGVSSHFFLGEVGRHSSGSIGFAATQGFQFGVLGASLTLGSDYYLTNQRPPPFTRGMQTFLVAVGPRVGAPVGPTRLLAGLEYANLAFVSNALTRYTGGSRNFHGGGVTAALRMESFMPIYVEFVSSIRHFPGMERRSTTLGFVLAIGIAGIL